MRRGRRTLLLLASHAAALGAGAAGGIYLLPILTAPQAPQDDQLDRVANQALYKSRFVRDLPGSDALHWGEGDVFVAATAVALRGRLAPGPDYKLYLSPVFVRDESEFLAQRGRMRRVGDIRTFHNFVVDLPPGADPAAHTTVVVWCETFGQFISAARYR